MFRCFNTTLGKIILGIVALAAAYLVVWHSVHIAAAAPFLLLFACPLMHVLMHGSHHGRHGHDDHRDTEK